MNNKKMRIIRRMNNETLTGSGSTDFFNETYIKNCEMQIYLYLKLVNTVQSVQVNTPFVSSMFLMSSLSSPKDSEPT